MMSAAAETSISPDDIVRRIAIVPPVLWRLPSPNVQQTPLGESWIIHVPPFIWAPASGSLRARLASIRFSASVRGAPLPGECDVFEDAP